MNTELVLKTKELFPGALIRVQDLVSFTAIITEIHGNQVNTVDVYRWHAYHNYPLNSIIPVSLEDTPFLIRMGFFRDVSSINPQFLLDTPQGMLTLVRQNDSWLLTNGELSTPVLYAHQVQAASKQLFGVTIAISHQAEKQQSEEAYYIE